MNEDWIDSQILKYFIESEQKEVERIPTLNQMGWMLRKLDDITQQFMDFTILNKNSPSFRTLEIGAAYGDIALTCLKNGVLNYTVNDIDKRHLEIFKYRVQKEGIDSNTFITAPGDFPDEVQFSPFYDSILIAKVLNLFEPDKWSRAIKMLFYLIKPGGKIFVTSTSPYVKPFVPFLPTYAEKKESGDLFPGYVNNIYKTLDLQISSEKLSTENDSLPLLNFMCKDLLTYHFENAGFKVLEAKEFPFHYTSVTWQYDGRENSGLIATKK